MNIWDYLNEKPRKNGHLAKYTQKIPNAIGKGFHRKVLGIFEVAYLLAGGSY